MKTSILVGDSDTDENNQVGDHEISDADRTPTVVQDDLEGRSVDQKFLEINTDSSFYGVIVFAKPYILELRDVLSDGKQAVANYMCKNFGLKYKEESLKHGDAHPDAFEPLTDDGEIKLKSESLRDPEVAESGTSKAEESNFKVARENYILKSKPLKIVPTGIASDDASGMRGDSESLGSNGIDGNVASSVTSNGTIQPFKQNLMQNGSKLSEQKWRVYKKNYEASIGSLLTQFLEFLFFISLLLIKKRTKCKDGHFKPRIHLLHLLLLFICVCSCMKAANGELEKVPRNTVSFMNNGSQTKMECWSGLGHRLKWYGQSNSSSERKELYSGYSVNSEALSYCHVKNGGPGKDILSLTSIGEAAQTYTCLEPGSLHKASAELIVIDETKCRGNSVDSYIKITCSVPFRGNWAPVLEWKQNEDILTDNVTSIVVPNREVTSTIFLPTSNFGASNYTCTTKFNIGGKPRQTTDNGVPSYTYVWNISTDLFANNDEGMSPSRINERMSPTTTAIINVTDDSDHQASSPMTNILIPLAFGLTVVCAIVAVLFKRCHWKMPKRNQRGNCKQNSSLMDTKSDVNPSA